MKIKQKALDGVNETIYDTKTGVSTTTLAHVFRPCVDLYDGENHIAHYETDTEFIEDFKRMKQQKEVIEEIREYINNYDVFKEFSFPLMKRDEENQVKSSIDYEFNTSIRKNLLQILDKYKN